MRIILSTSPTENTPADTSGDDPENSSEIPARNVGPGALKPDLRGRIPRILGGGFRKTLWRPSNDVEVALARGAEKVRGKL